MKKILAVVSAGLVLTACAPKVYAFELEMYVEGTGTAEVGYGYPGLTEPATETVQLPFEVKRIAEGMGAVSISVKPGSGATSCRILVEKREVSKAASECRSELTEDTAV